MGHNYSNRMLHLYGICWVGVATGCCTHVHMGWYNQMGHYYLVPTVTARESQEEHDLDSKQPRFSPTKRL